MLLIPGPPFYQAAASSGLWPKTVCIDLAEDRRPKTVCRREYQWSADKLSYHQLAAPHPLQFHGLIQSDYGAFHLIVGGGLGRDALQPQTRLGKRAE